jgi:L-fuconolactonase
LTLAAHDNIAVKIGGARTLSHEPFPYKDFWDPLFRVFDAFDFDCSMWAPDWQFCYYNLENRNIFGEAMRGC